MNAAHEPPRVTVITGASQGIGAGVAPGYLEPGSLSSIPPADAEDYLTFQGDIAHAKRHSVQRAGRTTGPVGSTPWSTKPGSTAATRNAPPSSSDPSSRAEPALRPMGGAPASTQNAFSEP
jgi:hypothetical protein